MMLGTVKLTEGDAARMMLGAHAASSRDHACEEPIDGAADEGDMLGNVGADGAIC